jgi:hypothetical protein
MSIPAAWPTATGYAKNIAIFNPVRDNYHRITGIKPDSDSIKDLVCQPQMQTSAIGETDLNLAKKLAL